MSSIQLDGRASGLPRPCSSASSARSRAGSTLSPGATRRCPRPLPDVMRGPHGLFRVLTLASTAQAVAKSGVFRSLLASELAGRPDSPSGDERNYGSFTPWLARWITFRSVCCSRPQEDKSNSRDNLHQIVPVSLHRVRTGFLLFLRCSRFRSGRGGRASASQPGVHRRSHPSLPAGSQEKPARDQTHELTVTHCEASARGRDGPLPRGMIHRIQLETPRSLPGLEPA